VLYTLIGSIKTTTHASFVEERIGVTMQFHSKASCRGEHIDVFFPDNWKGVRSSRKAKAICSTCEVTHQCLQYALKNEIHHGVWGGLNPYERARLIGRPRKQIY